MVFTARPREVEEFAVGDYVTLKDPDQAGIVYKVDDVVRNEQWPSLSDYKLRPVYGAFGAAERRGNRSERPESMTKVDIVRAGLEHLKMLDFIRNLARHYGVEPPDGTG